MAGQEFSGDKLLEALESEALKPTAPGGITLVGMLKRSDDPACVSFSPAGCDAWVDVPTDMIEKAVHVGERGCNDHSHPAFRITLKEPASAEGKLLAQLLMASSLTAAAGHLPMHAGLGPKPPAGAPLGLPSLPVSLNCDRHCQALLQICIAKTPFSSAFCVFLYSNCYHLCNLGGTIGDIFDLDATRR